MNRLYTTSLKLALPLLFLRLKRKAKTLPAYKERWDERLGKYAQAPHASHQSLQQSSIWIHTVSMGEFIAARPLIKALMEKYPDTPFVITTTTPTGSEQVVKTFGDSVQHVYLPFDLPKLLNRFIAHFKPKVALIMETELWPNMLAVLAKDDIPSVLLNARLSERSAIKYQKIAKTAKQMMCHMSQVIAQNNDDGQRFVRLGLANDKLAVAGNIKFDMTLADDIQQKAAQLKAHINPSDRPVWVVASTHEGEEDKIFTVYQHIKKQLPELLLCLIPRHPDRFDHVFALAQSHGLVAQRRSQQAVLDPTVDVVLGDSMGEMMHYYACADVVFVGGSLIPIGGHNLIEPALLAKPIMSGPHLENFVELKHLMVAGDALEIVDESALKDMVIHLLTDKPRATQLGNNGLQVATNNRGALQKHLDIISCWIAN